MTEKELSVKHLFPVATKANKDTIPRDQFERGIKNVGFQPSTMTIEKLADLLIDKKNPKLVNLKPIQSKLKNTIKKPDQAVAYLQKMPEKVRMTLDNI